MFHDQSDSRSQDSRKSKANVEIQA